MDWSVSGNESSHDVLTINIRNFNDFTISHFTSLIAWCRNKAVGRNGRCSTFWCRKGLCRPLNIFSGRCIVSATWLIRNNLFRTSNFNTILVFIGSKDRTIGTSGNNLVIHVWDLNRFTASNGTCCIARIRNQLVASRNRLRQTFWSFECLDLWWNRCGM